MTTDLTGDFGMAEDEYDWDVFLPDPDEADMEAEAAALEDETELSLDDSDFDWDAALSDDPGAESAADGDARAGAAYDRIVDTVRRSFEEEPPEDPEDAASEHEADAIPAFATADEAETPLDTQQGSVATAFAASLANMAPSDPDVDRVVDWTAETQPGPEAEPARRADNEPVATWRNEPAPEPEPAPVFIGEPGVDAGTDVDLEPHWEDEPELDQWLALEDDPLPEPTGPVPTVAFEPAESIAPVAPEFLETAADSAALVEAVESAPLPSSETDTASTMAPAESWEMDDGAEPSPHPFFDHPEEPHPFFDHPEEEVEKPGRSRVFKATVVLACLFLVAAAAVLAVRALHHTTAAPPAHVTTPTQAVQGAGASGAGSTGTARIQAATDAVDSATTAASVGLTSLSAFPTPTNVETVINPYISSLQLYETFLSGTKVPTSAQPSAASAVARIRQDLQFLETIDGLPPQQLGSFLQQFDTDATQLQTTLSTLEQDLRTPDS